MDIGAFVSLEDISANLPPYTEEVVSVPMDKPLAEAYLVQARGCCIIRLCLTTGRLFAELFWVQAALPRSGTR